MIHLEKKQSIAAVLICLVQTSSGHHHRVTNGVLLLFFICFVGNKLSIFTLLFLYMENIILRFTQFLTAQVDDSRGLSEGFKTDQSRASAVFYYKFKFSSYTFNSRFISSLQIDHPNLVYFIFSHFVYLIGTAEFYIISHAVEYRWRHLCVF